MGRFFIPRETLLGETRVAASPETVKKLVSSGCSVLIENDSGNKSGFLNKDYLEAGANLIDVSNDDLSNVNVVLCVNKPDQNILSKLSRGTLVIGLLEPYGNKDLSDLFQSKGFSAISLELLPRISRAQSSDALSSQANIAGYKSVLIAASELDRYFPMLMTAAGTVQPAKVVILGAGVAGLQAIATAKRLGAVVFVSDIRPIVKEQVESLGGKFIDPPDISEEPKESGGYAKQVSPEFLKAQREELIKHLSEADVAICTAQVPGKRAPLLIDEDMLKNMRKGSVVVDLAVSQGGNCFGSVEDKTVIVNGIKLIGASKLPQSVSNHASSLYSRNLLALIDPMITKGEFLLNTEDELIKGCLLFKDGVVQLPEVLSTGVKI